MEKLKCYFASPFFNEEQIEREEALKKILRDKGIEVFSPKENFVLKPDATDEERAKVFNDNVKHINNSDFVFAVTDGKDVGTIWECGYAFCDWTPVIYFCETLNGGTFNVMLANSGKAVIESRNELISLSLDELHCILKFGKKYIGGVE